jgi:methylthioribose-1-phosphate isomerase
MPRRLKGIAVEVFVSETRPRNQGLLTAWELRAAGVPHVLIADNAAGLLLMRGEVDMVITGADRIAANGDTANKVGTYLKALAAQAAGVPFYIAAPHSTLDFACADGGAIPIEDRGGDEVCHVRGLTPAGDIAELALAPTTPAPPTPPSTSRPPRSSAASSPSAASPARRRTARLYPEHVR